MAFVRQRRTLTHSIPFIAQHLVFETHKMCAKRNLKPEHQLLCPTRFYVYVCLCVCMCVSRTSKHTYTHSRWLITSFSTNFFHSILHFDNDHREISDCLYSGCWKMSCFRVCVCVCTDIHTRYTPVKKLCVRNHTKVKRERHKHYIMALFYYQRI